MVQCAGRAKRSDYDRDGPANGVNTSHHGDEFPLSRYQQTSGLSELATSSGRDRDGLASGVR